MRETIISSSFERPVLIHHYPTSIKAFYMQPDAQRPELALAFDMIAPEGYGEIIGGSQRIHDYDLLLKRLHEHKLPEESVPVVSRPAPLWQRSARRLRNGPRAHRRLDLRHRAHSRGHPLPSHDLPRVSLGRGSSALSRCSCNLEFISDLPGSSVRRGTALDSHESRLTELRMAQKVRIIGVPMDLGQSRRGVDMGPSAMRGAGLQSSLKKLGLQVEDIGNLSVKQPEEMPIGEKRAKYLQEIAETCGDCRCRCRKIPRRRISPAGSRRGPFHRGRRSRRRRQLFPQRQETDRLPLAGRARRHEHAGILSFR